jgi:hypothetical protein
MAAAPSRDPPPNRPSSPSSHIVLRRSYETVRKVTRVREKGQRRKRGVTPPQRAREYAPEEPVRCVSPARQDRHGITEGEADREWMIWKPSARPLIRRRCVFTARHQTQTAAPTCQALSPANLVKDPVRRVHGPAVEEHRGGTKPPLPRRMIAGVDRRRIGPLCEGCAKVGVDSASTSVRPL